MGFLSKVTNAVGKTLNNITGASSSAKTNQRYALQSMKVQNAYEKEAAQNAHQWEVADLEKAGLNPILSSGGTGAQADTGLQAGSGTSSGIDIMSSAGNLARTIAELPNFKKTGEQIEADTAQKMAQTDNIIAELPFISKKRKAEILNTHAQAQEHSAKAITEKGRIPNIIGKHLNEDKKNEKTKKTPPKPARHPRERKKNEQKFWEDLIKDEWA